MKEQPTVRRSPSEITTNEFKGNPPLVREVGMFAISNGECLQSESFEAIHWPDGVPGEAKGVQLADGLFVAYLPVVTAIFGGPWSYLVLKTNAAAN
jgi:hypothetical protein